MATSDEYDEFDAKVRVPKGERLAKSRDSPDGYRGFVHGGDRRMQHAEIFLNHKSDEEEEVEPNTSPSSDDRSTTYVYIVNDDAAIRREQEETDALLQALVFIALIKAAQVVSPHVSRWWNGRALPFITAKWERLRERRRTASQSAPNATSTVLEPELADSEEAAALEEYEVSMTSEEARKHLIDALIAKRFADEKMRLLANARIDDGTVPVELADAVRELTPKQVETSLDSLLATNPHLLTDLGQLLKTDRHPGPLQLGSDKVTQALRRTDRDGGDR